MPRQISPERVSLGSPSTAPRVLTRFEPVKVWDTIGEDKTLKGEYNVLARKMHAALFFKSVLLRRLTVVDCSNDLDWDGESKRIIAVGDGHDKSVIYGALRRLC